MLLIKCLPQCIEDMVVMYLSSDDIQRLGKAYISNYVWLRKKDGTIEEAVKNGNLIGLKYLVERCSIDLKLLENSILIGIKYLFEKDSINTRTYNDEVLRLSVEHRH